MGKKIIVVLFLLSLGLAIYFYLSHDRKNLRENLQDRSAAEPRITMEDFTLYRYRGELLVSKVRARLGHFYEPNVLELDGDVRGERLVEDGREVLSSESATAYFEATSLTKMMSGAELVRAELMGFVEFGVRGHLLSTDYAEYISKEPLVRSSRPVRVEGPGRVFTGEEGFVYSLATEILTMSGTVQGVLATDEK